MDYITLKGVAPYDGRYEFDLGGLSLTTREWGWIKRHAGYLPLTVDEGLAGADPELFAIFAVLALRRAGRIEDREVPDVFGRIADSPFETAIVLEVGEGEEEEDEASPPPRSSTGNGAISGDDSGTSLETSDASPLPIGTPALATSGLESPRLAN